MQTPDAAIAPERITGIDLVDPEGGSPTVRIERIATVGWRTYYRVATERESFEFYTTKKGRRCRVV